MGPNLLKPCVPQHGNISNPIQNAFEKAPLGHSSEACVCLSFHFSPSEAGYLVLNQKLKFSSFVFSLSFKSDLSRCSSHHGWIAGGQTRLCSAQTSKGRTDHPFCSCLCTDFSSHGEVPTLMARARPIFLQPVASPHLLSWPKLSFLNQPNITH